MCGGVRSVVGSKEVPPTLRADKWTPALEEPSEAREDRVTVPERSARPNPLGRGAPVLAEEVLRFPVAESTGGVISWFDKVL